METNKSCSLETTIDLYGGLHTSATRSHNHVTLSEKLPGSGAVAGRVRAL